MAPGTGTCKEKISTWTEILTQLVEAKFFSRLHRLTRFFRSPLAWKAQCWTPLIYLLGRFQNVSLQRCYKPCKNWSVYRWYNCLGQSCHWVSRIISACAYWSCKWGKVSIKQKEVSVGKKKKEERERKKNLLIITDAVLKMINLKFWLSYMLCP